MIFRPAFGTVADAGNKLWMCGTLSEAPKDRAGARQGNEVGQDEWHGRGLVSGASVASGMFGFKKNATDLAARIFSTETSGKAISGRQDNDQQNGAE